MVLNNLLDCRSLQPGVKLRTLRTLLTMYIPQRPALVVLDVCEGSVVSVEM